ncbi:methyl-accepting chemotaxis protein [Marinomonas sp. 2405UD68-3]|uniref:methyl-accepting chemotaxis protein n=1 Tax=Marinomonas sp. 2405UD68-3 TaxID=3391835 RepID=UPI0039C97AFE
MSIYNINKQTQVTIEDDLLHIGKVNATRLSNWLKVQRDGVVSLSKAVRGKTEHADIAEMLVAVQEGVGLSKAYYGLPNGDMHMPEGLNIIKNYDPRKRGWYKAALESDDVITTAPFTSAASGALIVSVAKKVINNGHTLGVMAGTINLGYMLETIKGLYVPGDGFAFIVAQNGTVIVHPESAFNTKPISELDTDLTLNMIQDDSLNDMVFELNFDGEGYFVSKTPLEGTNFYLIMSGQQSVLFQPVKDLMNFLIVLAIVLIVVFLVIASKGIKILLSSLTTVSSALQLAAEGNGDLTKRIPVNSSDEIGRLASNFNNFAQHLQDILLKIEDVTSELTTEAKSVSNSAANQIKSTKAQQDEITMVATAVTEMSSATHEIAKNAEKTARASNHSVEIGNQGQVVAESCEVSINKLSSEVNSATSIISQLEKQSLQVNSIVETISGIAEQTNLLALNAAIEAARAGEQGRGFAVVADEVRVLSQRTHQSTEEISSMITSFNETILVAVKSMENCHELAVFSVKNASETNSSFAKIKDSIQEINDMSAYIATAAEEQNQVTGEVARSTESIKNASLDFFENAENGAGQSKHLNQLAINLDSLLRQFTLR